MEFSVTRIALIVVVVLVIIVLFRWFFYAKTKIAGMNDAKKVTKISASDLEQKDEQTLYCDNCEKNIIDTQYILEKELVNILKENKETCLKISRLNPMFRFV